MFITEGKYTLVLILVSILLLIGYNYLAPVFFWFLPGGSPGWIPCLISAYILAFGALFLLSWRLDDFLESWEEDFVMELTVHQEPLIFYFTVAAGVFLTFLAGAFFETTWPVTTGLVVAGNFLLLYLVDIVLAIVYEGEEAIFQIFSEPEHALSMLGTSILVLVIAVGFSYSRYGKITWQKEDEVVKEETWRDKIEGFFFNTKSKIEEALSSSEKEKAYQELSKILREIDPKELQSWLEELKKKNPEANLDEIIQKLKNNDFSKQDDTQ